MSPVNRVDINASLLALGVSEIEYMYMNNKVYPPIAQEPASWMNVLCSNRWTIKHWINGKDAILNTQKLGLGDEVMYGVIAVENNSPTEYVMLIRGTESIIEWVEDAEFLLVDNDESGSRVEDGFFSVFQSLTVEGIPLRTWVRQNLFSIDKIKLTIACHSLGSAVGCYAAAFIGKDAMAVNRDPIRLVTFACPRPGDAKFAAFMADHIACNSVVYNYSRDLVPKLPPFDDFRNPPNVVVLEADPAIKIPDNPISNHLLPAYEALLNPEFITALQASNVMGVFENGKLRLASLRSFLKSSWNALKSFF